MSLKSMTIFALLLYITI